MVISPGTLFPVSWLRRDGPALFSSVFRLNQARREAGLHSMSGRGLRATAPPLWAASGDEGCVKMCVGDLAPDPSRATPPRSVQPCRAAAARHASSIIHTGYKHPAYS